MSRYVGISDAAEILGVSVPTLRRWEASGRLAPDHRTEGGQRRYDATRLAPERFHAPERAARKTVAYARVSSQDQRADLTRQKQVLEAYCAGQGWTYEIVADLGSGMNDRKQGLRKLLDAIVADKVGRLVVTHKDRLLRFGAELVFAVCEAKQVEVVILNQGEDASFEEDLAKDVLEIITVFSARLYGARSHKTKQLIETIEAAAQEAEP